MDYIQNILQIILSLISGALIGYEREIAGKAAGLRTHMILTLATCFLVIAGIETGMNEISRLLQGILAGMGFIGAGAIISRQTNIIGITTASSLWSSTIIGILFGLEKFYLGIVLTLIIFVILRLGLYENQIIKNKNKKIKFLCFH